MNKSNKTHILSALITLILSVLLIIFGNNSANYSSSETVDGVIERAVVTEILSSDTTDTFEADDTTEIVFNATLSDGTEISAKQVINNFFFPVPREVSSGDNVLLSNMNDFGDSDFEWYYTNHNMLNSVVILIIGFIISVLIICTLKGLFSIVSLILTVATIFLVYIPHILIGNNIYTLTIIIGFFIILSSLIILNGFNKKTLCAIVGNMGGVLLSGLLAVFAINFLGITGSIDEDYLFLTMLPNGVTLDLKALVWGGILISSLGAIMDVAMSISSSMHELSAEMKDRTFGRMVKSGINIGRDAVGTMVNTLVLAYIGSSLATTLLLTSYNRDMLVLLNFEMILLEIAQAIVGSMGILLAVPITVFFSAWIYNKSSNTQ